MKVLFAALHHAYYRNFDSVVRELAARGHQVHLTSDEPEDLWAAVLRRKGRQYALLSTMPPDPSLN